MVGAARVLCQFMLAALYCRRDDERLLLARSSRWAHGGAVLQRLTSAAAGSKRSLLEDVVSIDG